MGTVLVADDDRDAREVMAELLKETGYSVVSVDTVKQVLELLDERDDIDVVVSDIRMPEYDGFDLVRVLRTRMPQLPIVLVTGLPIGDDDVVPRDAVIVQKPVRVEELQRAIQDAIERKSNRRHTRDQ